MTALFILLVILQALDAWTTIQALKRPGLVESNKFLAWLIDKIGLKEALLLVKVASCAIVWIGVMNLFGMGHRQLAFALLGGGCAFYAAVVWNNWKFLKH